jgi:DNA-binding LacI/PurR family transcriptional regulator
MPLQTKIEVERELLRRIASGRHRPGSRIPPERELAAAFGCSRGTVSKAVASLAEAGALERRHGAGTFVAEQARTPRGNTVTYLSPADGAREEGSRTGVLEGMHEVLDGAGFRTGIDFYSTPRECAACLRKLRGADVAGVVLWPAPGAEVAAETRRLAASGVAVVMIDTFLPDVECDYVVSDNIAGASDMARHLASLGHHDICYLTGKPDRSSLVDRMAGFLKGMVMAGLPFSAENVRQVNGDLKAVVASLLRRKKRPTALFAANDMKAVTIINALREAGVDVPGEMSVAGYDGVEAGRLARPSLTTMEQDFKGMAAKASHILLERLGGRPVKVFYRVYVKPKLVKRKSTGEVAS